MNAVQTATANFAVIPAPVIAVSPGSLTFATSSSSTSAAQTLQLSNTGNAVLNITGITLGGAGASAFAQTNTCGTTLAAGTNCIISVTFAPTSVATFSATLSVASNAAGTVPTVNLSGTATAAATFILGATPASQTISQGSTASFAVTLSPQGGAFN